MGDGVVGGALLGAQGAAGPRLARAGTHTLVSSTVQYSTVQYSTVQYSTVQYSTARAGTHTLVSRLPRASADRELNMYGFCRISQTGILHIPDNILEFYSLFSLTASCMSPIVLLS